MLIQKIQNFTIRIIYYISLDRGKIYLCRFLIVMSHTKTNCFHRNILGLSDTCPRMAGYIEYKNKTQEKCNYCTIYQCISGFYKKNVELHLLLILAIDSVIYSFYVTILLCKKAPVFD